MSADATIRDWVVLPKTPTRPRVRLLCFPYAGGGTAIFRDWAKHLPEDIAVCAMKLPGREARFSTPAISEANALADAMMPALAALTDAPLAVFGHSMGAILAFEAARRLTTTVGRPPVHLFAAGRQAPHIPDPEEPCHHLDDDAFMAALQVRYGSRIAALQHPELIELMLPTLRADCALCETYEITPAAPLSCPLTAIGGAQDRMVTTDDLDSWREHTTGVFDRVVLEGDHFFVDQDPAALTAEIAARLTGAA